MLSFYGTELSRRVRSHSQASLQASLGMGPDEPGQLCTEEMTAWDSLSLILVYHGFQAASLHIHWLSNYQTIAKN